MQAAIEIIDVEEFHENLQRKALDTLKRKNKTFKLENQKLDEKINHLHRANDALSHKLFEQDQRRIAFARLLGFESIESAEASITSEDPWVPGGKAALSEARDRIILLEDELTKHITAGEDAHAMITETKEKLEATHRHLDDVLDDVRRLREERDLARQEAEKQAMEASKWRTELQTILPEMQTLIRKQQEDTKALLLSRFTASTEKEDLSPKRLARNPSLSPLHEDANAFSLPAAHSSPSSLITAYNAKRYKQQFELLQAQYEALRETKEKISRKFYEQLVRWKKYKHWLVREEMQGGRKLTFRRRFSKRRKAMEIIGPQIIPPNAGASNKVLAAAQNEAVDSPDVNPLPGDDTCGRDQFHRYPAPLLFPVKSDPKDFLTPSRTTPHLEESLTQPSTIPASQHSRSSIPTPNPHQSTGLLQDHLKFCNNIPLSQQSLTQPSSMPSLSPVQAPQEMIDSFTTEVAQPKVFVVDSPVREVTVVGQEESIIKREETSQKNYTSIVQRITSSSPAPETPIRTKTPHTSTKRLFQLRKPKVVQPITEPPINRLRHSRSPHVQAVRRTRTMLVTDTPHRTTMRHHSSPPDSPYQHCMNGRKRKANEIEDDGDESDPFRSGPSRVGINTPQARGEKPARPKASTKKPNNAYMSEYMQFKGRGRYSNANVHAKTTVNGKFEIDSERNDGMNFQYDAVVRDKDERRRLEAVDCECCRDYYEAIGSLPPRLQAPLWKSPSSDKDHAARPCRYGNNRIHNKMSMSSPSARMHAKAVEDHKRSISRHRHAWAPPNTPPDFWNIEFPDTPRVNDINRRADEMHAHKFERVEAETNSINGRYRKRT